jgi:hypothetical protein
MLVLAAVMQQPAAQQQSPPALEVGAVAPDFSIPGATRFGLLKNGGEQVTRLHFLPLRALDVEHRRLQNSPERGRLLRVPFLPLPHLFDAVVEIAIEIAAELRQIGAAGAENAFAVRIVRQGVQQVLEGQIRVATRCGFAIGDGENGFDGGREHPGFLILFDSGAQREACSAR